MAVETPTIINNKFVIASNSNSYRVPGFAGVTAGNLLLFLGLPRQGGRPYTAPVEDADAWRALNSAGTMGDDLSSWTRANLDVSPGQLSGGQNATVIAWKFADGDETNTRDLIGMYGFTSFGTFPRYYGLLELSGCKTDVPVRQLSTWKVLDTSGGTGPTNIPSASPGTVEPNSLEILSAIHFSTTAGTWGGTTTALWSDSRNTEGSVSAVVRYRTANSDGSLNSAAFTGAGVRYVTRIIVQGIEPPDPQYPLGDVEGVARAQATARNVSQERRNTAQAIDRRQHIWVSDIHGERKVVLR